MTDLMALWEAIVCLSDKKVVCVFLYFLHLEYQNVHYPSTVKTFWLVIIFKELFEGWRLGNYIHESSYKYIIIRVCARAARSFHFVSIPTHFGLHAPQNALYQWVHATDILYYVGYFRGLSVSKCGESVNFRELNYNQSVATRAQHNTRKLLLW